MQCKELPSWVGSISRFVVVALGQQYWGRISDSGPLDKGGDGVTRAVHGGTKAEEIALMKFLIQGVPTFCDFWFQEVIMKCKDHEFQGLFLVSNHKMDPKHF